MELKDQVVSLEIAKRLKELGFKQESLFWYVINNRPEKERTESELEAYLTNIWDTDRWGDDFGDKCAAFTVAELGEMLPISFHNGLTKEFESVAYLNFERSNNIFWKVGYKFNSGNLMFGQYAETEAAARGKMLIYLAENGLIKPIQNTE